MAGLVVRFVADEEDIAVPGALCKGAELGGRVGVSGDLRAKPLLVPALVPSEVVRCLVSLSRLEAGFPAVELVKELLGRRKLIVATTPHHQDSLSLLGQLVLQAQVGLS